MPTIPKKLTDLYIKNAKPGTKPYKLRPREDGLFIWVRPNGRKWWRFAYTFNGNEKGLSFGISSRVIPAKGTVRTAICLRRAKALDLFMGVSVYAPLADLMKADLQKELDNLGYTRASSLAPRTLSVEITDWNFDSYINAKV